MTDTGTGKTFICIQSLFDKLNSKELDKGLIVCTKSSILSFQGDIKSTNYSDKNLIVIKNNEDLEAVKKANNKLFLIQYESLLNLDLRALFKAFNSFKSGLYIDEVHKIKTVGKKNTKKVSYTGQSLEYLKKAFVVLVGLTATTMTSKLEDSYRVVSFIRPKALGGYKWFSEHFYVTKKGTRWDKKRKIPIEYTKIVEYKNLEDFDKYTEDVIIKFFPKLDYRFKVLSKSLKEGSKRFEKYEELAESTHGNNNHSSIMPKLQRLVDKSKEKKLLLKKAIERCRENGLIVYTRTRKANMLEYIQSILEESGMEIKTICGSTKLKDREAVLKWGFSESFKNKALIITDAGGQSLNLFFTNNLLFWEIPMGIGKFLQVKGRIGRMFSKWDHYNFYFLLIKNTIDEYWYLRFTSHKDTLNSTADDSAIPVSKMNDYNENKLKRLRDNKVWRKTRNRVRGKKKESELDKQIAKNLARTKKLN